VKIIKTARKPATVPFSLLRGGDLFRHDMYDDVVWLKLERTHVSNNANININAVSTSDGCWIHVSDDREVEPLPHAELHTNADQ
jgi:hypothetical protein